MKYNSLGWLTLVKTLPCLWAVGFSLYVIFATLGCATSQSGNNTMESGLNNPDLFWPSPPQTPRIQYLGSISSPSDVGVKKSWIKKALDRVFGEEDSDIRMMRPYGVCADSEKIYVTDPGMSLLHVFDIRDKKYFTIDRAMENEFISPIGVAADKNGDIYLSDSMLRKVFVLDKEGNYLREIGSPDLFVRPAGIAIDEDRVYVIDTHGHRVLVFAKKDGTHLFSFGKHGTGEGELNYPTNIFTGRNKLVYITDSMNFRVQIFGRDGNFLSSLGKLGDGSGDFSKPKGVAVDSEGHIYVTDAHFDNVQIFDRDGQLLLYFGNTGSGRGEMVLPAGLYIDEKDRIYAADSYNNRVQIFQYLREKEGQAVRAK